MHRLPSPATAAPCAPSPTRRRRAGQTTRRGRTVSAAGCVSGVATPSAASQVRSVECSQSRPVSQVQSVECELHLHSFFNDIYPIRWDPRCNPLRTPPRFERRFLTLSEVVTPCLGRDGIYELPHAPEPHEVSPSYKSAVSSKARETTKESTARTAKYIVSINRLFHPRRERQPRNQRQGVRSISIL